MMWNKPKTIWANALLSDGEILFWYTGDRCDSWKEFYKDFYYAHINMTDYESRHKLEVVRIGFVDETPDGDYNPLCFDTLAKDFYRQWGISKDSKGAPPYESYVNLY